MVLSWFDVGQVKAFGVSLAQFFIQRVPLDSAMGEKAFAVKADKVLEKMSHQVTRFKLENRLNPYKKAQLGNVFKWELRDAGYPPSYADKLTKWLMLQIS
jgi:hypothetical protein